MHRLDGWKEIATHLRVSVKTAQRWAARAVDPLPVHDTTDTGRILAFREELDVWNERRRRPRNPLAAVQ